MESQQKADLLNWDDQEKQAQIKEMFGNNLTPIEWSLFLQIGKSTGLNPFLREIWAVKYGNSAASIFIGRDGYRRSAQNHPEYEYHFADAVYSNDTYKVVNGEVTHEYCLGKISVKDRGTLIGAYCVVKRKSASRPAITFVDLKEYLQTFGVWKTKPATMIKKVAEAQALRASFQELFAGTYEESEDWKEDSQDNTKTAPTPVLLQKASPHTTVKTKPSKEQIVDFLKKAQTLEQLDTIYKQALTYEWSDADSLFLMEHKEAEETRIRSII